MKKIFPYNVKRNLARYFTRLEVKETVSLTIFFIHLSLV